MRAWVYLNISDPLVAWAAYRGILVSADRVGHPHAISHWHANLLRSAPDAPSSYRVEQLVEQTRQRTMSECASRLVGFYAFPDRQTAIQVGARSGFDRSCLVEIEILEGSTISSLDSAWWQEMPNPSGTGWIESYLSGRSFGPHRQAELVIQGKALVLGTGIRERARDVVLGLWPESAPLLEFARLGVELDSNLGLISARVSSGVDIIRVGYILDMRDADEPDFLDRLGTYSGPIDHAAINNGPDSFRVPDLRDHEFTIALR